MVVLATTWLLDPDKLIRFMEGGERMRGWSAPLLLLPPPRSVSIEAKRDELLMAPFPVGTAKTNQIWDRFSLMTKNLADFSVKAKSRLDQKKKGQITMSKKLSKTFERFNLVEIYFIQKGENGQEFLGPKWSKRPKRKCLSWVRAHTLNCFRSCLPHFFRQLKVSVIQLDLPSFLLLASWLSCCEDANFLLAFIMVLMVSSSLLMFSRMLYMSSTWCSKRSKSGIFTSFPTWLLSTLKNTKKGRKGHNFVILATISRTLYRKNLTDKSKTTFFPLPRFSRQILEIPEFLLIVYDSALSAEFRRDKIKTKTQNSGVFQKYLTFLTWVWVSYWVVILSWGIQLVLSDVL